MHILHSHSYGDDKF